MKKTQNKDNKELSIIQTNYDEATETAIIGAIILEAKQSFLLLPEIPNPNDFYFDEHQKLMTTIIYMKKNNIDIDMLSLRSEALKMHNQNFTQKIAELTMYVNSSAHIATHYYILKEFSLKRKLFYFGAGLTRLSLNNEKDALELLNETQKDLQDITLQTYQGTQKKIFSGKDVSNTTLAQIKENISNRNSGLTTGIATNLQELDSIVGGWKKGKLYIVAARPSMGKTTFATKIAYEAIKQDKYVLFFSLEMTKEEVFSKFLVLEANNQIDEARQKGMFVEKISNMEVENGKLNADQLFFLERASEKINLDKLFIIDTPNISNQDFNNFCFSQKEKHGLDLVVSDYIQLKKGDKSERKDIELGSISANSKRLAKTLDVPVVELAQLNRNVESRATKTPGLSDLKNTGNFEEDADVVIMLHRPTYYGETTFEDGTNAKDCLGLYIRKNRSGAVPMNPIVVKYETFSNQIDDIYSNFEVQKNILPY